MVSSGTIMARPRKEGLPEHFEIPSYSPEIVGVADFAELSKQIRSVTLLNDSIKGLYPYLSSQITLEEVRTSDIKPCALYVLKQNLAIQEALRKQFLQKGIDTLHLTSDRTLISYTWGGVNSVLIPPIIEVSEDDNFVFVETDGLHRTMIARDRGEKTITAVVIRNTAVPLSVLPVEWNEVKCLDAVPPTNEKRRMRFTPSQEMFRWFGLNERNLQRLAGGFKNPLEYSYRAFFRALDFKVPSRVPLFQRPRDWGYDGSGHAVEFARSKEECLREYTSAGFIVTSLDSHSLLLGNHHEAPNLWGNFAGARNIGENDPKITAARELEEELGIKVDPKSGFSEPLIVIDNHRGGRKPGIGIIYQLKIDLNREIKIPDDSEIKEISWMGTMPLLDESDPTERLWGGVYTLEALRVFDKIHRQGFGGMVQVNSYKGGFGLTPYEQLKATERAS